ncbi:hypothetical protein C8R47DRAFT_800769 [Mycena vitilis]|nr:hypothetical protein C8R47DRAFT_800769 [Mycena vitilis]
MARLLPDETLLQILGPVLSVPEEDFSDLSGTSPFAKYSLSTSNLLLVNKAWLRVGTPPLYEVAILRSLAQALALGRTLERVPSLGRFVKKLRVEGGYGPIMETVLRFSPNISHLCIPLDIRSPDNTAGLCKGLPFLNPERLILMERNGKRLKNGFRGHLLAALCRWLFKWDHLTTLEIPHLDVGRNDWLGPILSEMAMGRCRHINKVVLPGHQSLTMLGLDALERTRVRLLQIKAALPPAGLPSEVMAAIQRRKYKVEYSVQESAGLIQTTFGNPLPLIDPAYVPFGMTAPNVRDAIVDCILRHALCPPVADVRVPRSTRHLPLLTVSKMFYRLALPHFYRYIVVTDPKTVRSLQTAVRCAPIITPRIRVLSFLLANPDPDPAPLVEVFSRMTGLERIIGLDELFEAYLPPEPSIPFAAFEALATASGETMREFSGAVQFVEDLSPEVFNRFRQLRALHWCSAASFVRDPEYLKLDHLTELRLSWFHSSFSNDVLSCMELPALASLALGVHAPMAGAALIRAHGAKLRELEVICSSVELDVLELCPNLVCLTLRLPTLNRIPALDRLPGESHDHLRKLVLGPPILVKNSPETKPDLEQWNTFFAALIPMRFPALQEVSLAVSWPKTESEIASSAWVRWAEGLMRNGIPTRDASGTRWRGRLAPEEHHRLYSFR